MRKSETIKIFSAHEMKLRIFDVRKETNISKTVAKIIDDVRLRGDKALIEMTRQFDRCEIDSVIFKSRRVKIDRALENCMKTAFARILKFHKETADESKLIRREGEILGRIVRPLRRVGVYVPGGSAPLFSTLLMAVGAARAAGVKEIAVATPPPVNDLIIAAARIAGVSEIYSVGGAQAIAALAFGTESVKPVDKIVGPGNRFVAEAKRQVFGRVGIDSIAGPSEILILADESSSPKMIAADMIAQAEHDIFARSILLTSSRRIGEAVILEIEEQLKDLPRRDIAKSSLAERGIIGICRDSSEMLALANMCAPEHLEIMIKKPWEVVKKIYAAGAIFVGNYSPEILGDYVAGPNHILPTGGTARFSPPLSARDFVAVSTVQSFSKKASSVLAKKAVMMARAEGLEAHARSIESRFYESRFGKSRFDESRFYESRFDESRFDESRFDESRFDESRFYESRFDESRFDESRFDESRFGESKKKSRKR